MNDFPIERFSKILGLLHSDNDGERLAALQRAQSMLQQYNLRWSDLIPKQLHTPTQPQTSYTNNQHQSNQPRPQKRPPKTNQRTTPRPPRARTNKIQQRYVPINKLPDQLSGEIISAQRATGRSVHSNIPQTEIVYVVRQTQTRQTVYGPFFITHDNIRHIQQYQHETGKESRFTYYHEQRIPYPILYPKFTKAYNKKYGL